MGQLTTFDEQLPDHIRAAFGDPSANSDLAGGVSAGFPILSIKGKAWHVVQGDVRTLVTDDEGEPRSSIEVVILKANPHVSKVYYPNGYTEGSDEKPACFSHDGIAPDVGAAEPQSSKCATCKRAIWGSRITESGAKGKECSDSRRLAVAPSGDLTNPHLLRVPAATLKDLAAYGDLLAKRRAPYQAVVTKIGFDHTVAHQKLTFKALRWLDAAEVAQVAETLNGTVVDSIVGLSTTHAEGPVAAEDDEIAGERPSNIAQLSDQPKAAPKATVTSAEVEAILETPAAVEPEKPKGATGFGGKKVEAKVEAQPAPKVEAKAEKPKLIDAANASLDDILATLDDD